MVAATSVADTSDRIGLIMSGIFGIFDAHGRSVPSSVSAIADRLKLTPTQSVQLYCAPSQCAALGRVRSSVYNAAPQPVWNYTQTVAVVFAGCLNRDASGLSAHAALTDEEQILALYEQHGAAMTRLLHGSFALALYDAARRTVLVATDRMGTYPIYYAHRHGRFLFAPTQNALLCDKSIAPELDLTGLAQYMRFQQLLHDTSFFKHIKLLRGSYQLLYALESDTLVESAYWKFDPELPIGTDLTFEEAADETARLVVQAVDRCSRGAYRLGTFLSGGLDSRVIVAALAQLGRSPSALTFGSPASRDTYYARLVAQQGSLTHRFCCRTDGQWVKQYWRQHLLMTDASHSWIHMHGIYALEEARQLMDVNLSGFAGDSMLSGIGLRDEYLTVVDDMAYAATIFNGLIMFETWPGMTETDEQLLYTGDIFALIKGRAFTSLCDALAPFSAYAEPLRTELFTFYTSDVRHYAHYMDFKRSAVEIGLPFIDPDLVRFVLYLPTDYRNNRRLARAVLRRLSKPLSRIPYDFDELLPTDETWLRSTHEFYTRAKRRSLRLLGIKRTERATLHSDYENWLRTDLRDWAESILFDRRTLERGLFEPNFLRSLWRRHLSGRELYTIGKLAPIISYELMLREFVDQSPAVETCADKVHERSPAFCQYSGGAITIAPSSLHSTSETKIVNFS